VPRLADQGRYIASESSFYRVLKAAHQIKHRRSERLPQPRTKPKALAESLSFAKSKQLDSSCSPSIVVRK